MSNMYKYFASCKGARLNVVNHVTSTHSDQHVHPICSQISLFFFLQFTLCNNSVCLFVLRFLRPSQPNGVMSSAVSLPNDTFTGQA